MDLYILKFVFQERNNMLQDRLYLRSASMEDADLLYRWRNEVECRKNSVNTGYIEYDSHCKWLSDRLGSGCYSIFICMREYGRRDESVGQTGVGYNMDRCGEISYSIDAGYRYNGYGTRMLALLEEMEEVKKNVDRLCAVVKITNIASQRCFEKLRYLKSVKEDMVYYVKDI